MKWKFDHDSRDSSDSSENVYSGHVPKHFKRFHSDFEAGHTYDAKSLKANETFVHEKPSKAQKTNVLKSLNSKQSKQKERDQEFLIHREDIDLQTQGAEDPPLTSDDTSFKISSQLSSDHETEVSHINKEKKEDEINKENIEDRSEGELSPYEPYEFETLKITCTNEFFDNKTLNEDQLTDVCICERSIEKDTVQENYEEEPQMKRICEIVPFQCNKGAKIAINQGPNIRVRIKAKTPPPPVIGPIEIELPKDSVFFSKKISEKFDRLEREYLSTAIESSDEETSSEDYPRSKKKKLDRFRETLPKFSYNDYRFVPKRYRRRRSYGFDYEAVYSKGPRTVESDVFDDDAKRVLDLNVNELLKSTRKKYELDVLIKEKKSESHEVKKDDFDLENMNASETEIPKLTEKLLKKIQRLDQNIKRSHITNDKDFDCESKRRQIFLNNCK
ncbi:titin homolog [Battus philenor]|uniref:titin homolog n=1 Tax=Battus philenor TaxID=42288 RepID=UPI0035CF1B9E